MDLGFEVRRRGGRRRGRSRGGLRLRRGGRSRSRTAEPFTTTLPVISGWIAHRYENVPACLNVRFHDPPSAIVPLLNAPSLAVTVCARSSSLRNVTEPPAAIVTVAGLNARPAIETEGDEAGADPSTSRLRRFPHPPRSARDTACRRRRARRGTCTCRSRSAASNTTGPARDCGSRIRRVRTASASGAARCRRSRSGSSRRREPSARPAKGDP